MITYNNKEYRNLEEQVLKNKQDIAYHYEIDRTLANFGIKVIGVIANVSELPVPYTGDYGDAYAIGQPGDYTYYIWTRANPDLGEPDPFWLDAGKLAIDTDLGTIVTVDGKKQTTWNADTKLDKYTGTGVVKLYATRADGTQWMYTLGTVPGNMTSTNIPQYWSNTTDWQDVEPGGVLASGDPKHKYHVATKNYVDSRTADKNTTNTLNAFKLTGYQPYVDGTYTVYIGGAAGGQFSKHSIACYYDIKQGNADVPSQENTVEYMALYTGTPVRDLQAANKKYVDTKTALYKTTIEIEDGLTGESYTLYMNTHKNMGGSTGMELQELCQFLSESGEDGDYSGMNAFLFEHIAISGQGLYFIAAIDDQIDDNGTVVFGIRVGNQSNFLAINGSALCVVRQSKA